MSHIDSDDLGNIVVVQRFDDRGNVIKDYPSGFDLQFEFRGGFNFIFPPINAFDRLGYLATRSQLISDQTICDVVEDVDRVGGGCDDYEFRHG